jgi:hypothetical protein
MSFDDNDSQSDDANSEVLQCYNTACIISANIGSSKLGKSEARKSKE